MNQNAHKIMTAIATLGSHCALQVLKGAHDEGLESILVCEKVRESLYKRFSFIDEIILVDSFKDILDNNVTEKLVSKNAVLVPHGTLVAQMSPDEIESIKMPIFGNRDILRWESNRELKEKMMRASNLPVPRTIKNPSEIDCMVIVKRHGAAGGKGYFIASTLAEYEQKHDVLIKDGVIKAEENMYIQEYIPGVLAYLQYFYSPLKKRLEFFGIDSRHESDIDGLARIPALAQINSNKIPSFNVIGNSAMVLRESLLQRVYEIGEMFVKASSDLVPPGMNGPFCIEGVYDENAKFTSFEFSARIVAGTNIYMEGSPYSTLLYDEPMSMGRRIARELKEASKQDKISTISN